MEEEIKRAAEEFKQQFSEDPDLMPIAEAGFIMGAWWMLREYQDIFKDLQEVIGAIAGEEVAKAIIAKSIDAVNNYETDTQKRVVKTALNNDRNN